MIASISKPISTEIYHITKRPQLLCVSSTQFHKRIAVAPGGCLLSSEVWKGSNGIIFTRFCNLKVHFKTVLTTTASRCYSFMKLSWADAKELRPFCYMALCYTRIEDARDRYSMFFIQPQKLFLSFLISREDVFLWKQKEQTGDLNKISFQKNLLK